MEASWSRELGADGVVSFLVELVDDMVAFDTLEARWEELLDDMAHPEVFYSWAWTRHFWRAFRSGDKLLVILLRDGTGTIVAIAPLCIRRTRRFGLAVRVAEPIVRGWNDYSNIMVRKGTHRGRVVADVLGYMRQQSRHWDVLDLPEFNTRDSTTLHVLNLAPQYPEWSVRRLVSTGVAVRRLSPDLVLKNRQSNRIRNRMKQLQARGLRIEIGSKDFDTYWPAFKAMHRQAWPKGAFSDPVAERFFDALLADPGLRDHIDLSVVELDGRPAAMHFGFIDDFKVYHYMPAMDQAFRSEAAGSVLLHAMIEHYARTRQVFDFMRGLEAYKLAYTDDLELNLRLVIYRSANLRALAYNFTEIMRRLGAELGFPKAFVQRLKGRTKDWRGPRQ